jgi:hypothetical protein
MRWGCLASSWTPVPIARVPACCRWGDDKAPDDYSQLGFAAKARISKSTLHVGTLIPKLPTVLPSDSRLLPQTFRGAQLQSREIDGLTLDVGQLTHNSLRNSSASDDMLGRRQRHPWRAGQR